MHYALLLALALPLAACQQAQSNPPPKDVSSAEVATAETHQDTFMEVEVPIREKEPVIELRVGELPKFEDYPATETPNARRTPLRPLSADDAMFRTRIGEVATQPVNFAGIYSVGFWGCGAQCLMGAVVSYNTGKPLYLPGSICCSDREDDWAEMRVDSRLLRLSGYINEQGLNGDHYYVLEGETFHHLLSVPGPVIDLDDLPETSRVRSALPPGPRGTIHGTYKGELGEPYAGTVYFKDVQSGDVYTTRTAGRTPAFEATLPVGYYVSFAYTDESMFSAYNVLDRESGWGWGYELVVFQVKDGGVTEDVNPSNFTGDTVIPKPD